MNVSKQFTNSLLFVVLLISSTARAQSEELVLVADPWCPFTCDSASKKPGLMIEIVMAALGPKYKIKYQNMSWARAVEDTRKGGYSAIVGALKNDAPDFVFPATPLAQMKSCFYVRSDSKWEFKGEGSLKGKTLGAVKDYAYGDQIDPYLQKSEGDSNAVDLITGTDTTARLFMKLKAKRVEIVIEDETVANYVLKEKAELSAEKFKQAGCLTQSPLFVAFSPSKPISKALAKDIDAGIKALKANKKFNEILAKYGAK